ncbi:ribosomal 50S subunit-recycling heat shock protein [Melghiribacillus thermohalophilus]|uniref:RQC P-site tRNA stabilizing factor n=1 Tax=Melghiribacillus thermohalophilus TaxID=1324956 RepID=A0A4R3MTI9_9BACI|nr:RNA-binding S4 domain-containing protein [Melghiribacillus thermohalophilus]TCT18166.1 ribosomal 50S subunit-recycling heat shock protein [Melghiribacillus thermohalophilus]
MRLDKFLKISRLIKRRTLVKEVAEQGRIEINGSVAKASSKVSAGDELTIRFGQKILTVKIQDLKEHVKKEDASSLYTVIKEENIQQPTRHE